MRRLILVDLYWTRDQDPRVPLGHASLLAALRQDPSLDVRSVVMAVNDPNTAAQAVAAAILEQARGSKPCDVAIGAYVWGEHLLQEVLPTLRAAGFEGRIILGGPQISYAAPGVAAIYPAADVFVRGYGEDVLLELASSPGRPELPGVVHAGAPDLGIQAQVGLEDLPSPWLSGAIPLLRRSFVRWETQRGCPFRCSFCQHREPGSRLRRRELAESRVMQEVDAFCAVDVEEIAVLDPIFNVGPLGRPVLARFVERGFQGRLSLQCRAECLDDPFLDSAAKLRIRLEFGLQTIHADESVAIERRNDMAKVDAALAATRRRGLHHEVSLIFGLPLQTLDSFTASVAWCLERRVPVIKAFPLMLLRGTELERTRARWNLAESGGPMPVVVASSTFGRAEWTEMARIAGALKVTEGRHPSSMRELASVARGLSPTWDRWQPRVKPRRGTGLPRGGQSLR